VRTDRFGADLPRQIHLDGTIDGNHVIELANDQGVIGVVVWTHLNRGIIIYEVQQGARADDEAGYDFLAVNCLTRSSNYALLDQVKYAV